MYCVYRNQAAAAYLSLYSIFFLSNFQALKILVTLFSGTMRPRRLKLSTHVDSEQMYRVYRNEAAAAYLSLYSVFFLSNFQALKIFVTLFSGAGRVGYIFFYIFHQSSISYVPSFGRRLNMTEIL